MAELRKSVEKALNSPAQLTRLYLDQTELAAPYDTKVRDYKVKSGSVLTVVAMSSEEFLPAAQRLSQLYKGFQHLNKVKLEHLEQPMPKRLQLQKLAGPGCLYT